MPSESEFPVPTFLGFTLGEYDEILHLSQLFPSV